VSEECISVEEFLLVGSTSKDNLRPKDDEDSSDIHRRHTDSVDEIDLRIRIEMVRSDLCTRYYNRFAYISQGECQCTCHECHRIGTCGDEEAIILIILLIDDTSNLLSKSRSSIGAIDIDDELDIDSSKLGDTRFDSEDFIDSMSDIERSCLRILDHRDRPSAEEDKDFFHSDDGVM